MQEWEHSKAEAAGQARLNGEQLSSGAGGEPDVAASPARKRGAANVIETRLEPETARAGRHTESSMAAAAKEFSAKDGEGWQTSAALKKALETWEGQAKGLVSRLTTEKAQLREVAGRFTSTEAGTADQLSRLKSGIDGL